MNLKKKRLKELSRRHKEEELVELRKNYERLTSMTGGFARGGTLIKTKTRISPPDTLPFLPAKVDPLITQHKTLVYSGKLAVREELAKEKSLLLKARVAPIGNKMGAQYLNDSDLADFQKGLLRRRT